VESIAKCGFFVGNFFVGEVLRTAASTTVNECLLRGPGVAIEDERLFQLLFCRCGENEQIVVVLELIRKSHLATLCLVLLQFSCQLTHLSHPSIITDCINDVFIFILDSIAKQMKTSMLYRDAQIEKIL
jgi:hypothetical protein